MKTRRFARIRRFRFNLPQRIAAGLLALFLAQGLWLAGNLAANCGLHTEVPSSPFAGSMAGCGDLHDGILACRLARLPAVLHLPALNLMVRMPFLAAGVLLGGALWWVTRRLYGNLGGYTALALYCFSPAILKVSVTPNPEILAALGVYGGIYTCIGVAHAMQGPRRKWRPRIVLLTAIFAVAAASHLAALAVVAVAGLAFMLWVAEGRRSQVLPVALIAVAGALAVVFVVCGFSPQMFCSLFRSGAGGLSLSLHPAARIFSSTANIGIMLAVAVAAGLYLSVQRSRYFGNTAPLLCALILFPLVMTGDSGTLQLWALPFLLTFVGGVLADAYELPKGRWAVAAAGTILLLQAVCCVLSLPGML